MSTPTKFLRHIRFRKPVQFTFPQELQDTLARQFLNHKAVISSATPPSPLPPAPIPTVISFQTHPVYTTGRREHGTLTDEQLELLKSPLESLNSHFQPDEAPEVWPTQRGGQTTFHGPGQLVVYPILDLKAQYPLWPRGLSPRCYVNLLEQTTINTLARWGFKGIRTENPGVWEEEGERKIAALGVHLRRNITSYGVGLNITTDLRYFDRIVACGLVGKKVTSMQELGLEKGIWPLPMEVIKLSTAAAVEADASEELKHMPVDPNIEMAAKRTIQTSAFDSLSHEERSALSTTKMAAVRVRAAWIDEFVKLLYGDDMVEKLEDLGKWKGKGTVTSTFEKS